MPQLLFRGTKPETVKAVSTGLVDELQEILGCPRDYFTLEIVPTTLIVDGREQAGRPFVQINWFDRGQDIQDQVAAAIHRHLTRVGEQAEIYFVVLEERKYYEDGVHY